MGDIIYPLRVSGERGGRDGEERRYSQVFD